MRLWILLLAFAPPARAARVPTIDDLMKVAVPSLARISPDGRFVAYTVTEPDFGHGISKPREARAAGRHNLEWFNHYIWGDPRPDFVSPDVPKTGEEKKSGKLVP